MVPCDRRTRQGARHGCPPGGRAVNTFRVFRLNVFVRAFGTRDAAAAFIGSAEDDPENYEILDQSDNLA